MNKKEYLSEEKYQKTKRVLTNIGLISLTIGIILIIASFFISERGTTVFMIFGAIVFGVFFPFVIFGVAFGREINAFNAQQSIPIIKEGMENVAPSMRNTSKEIAKGIKEGLSEEDTVYCKHCGQLIDSDSRFCKSCGKQQ